MEGGSANDYDYCSGDPVNCRDLDGSKQRPLTADEAQQVAKIAGDCLNGGDAYFSGSSFCKGFLTGLEKGDITDYGFGFVPNTRVKYLHCPSRLVEGSRFFGVGDAARGAIQFGGGDRAGGVRTGVKTTANYLALTEIAGKLGASKANLPFTAAATAVDALCTNF